MNQTTAVAQATHRSIALPALGTLLPHLGGTLGAIMRGKPGTGQEDYAIIVPVGAAFEIATSWGAEGKDEHEAACKWDGLANTRVLVDSKHKHPAAEFCAGLEVAGFQDLYLPSLRELKALYAAGCEAYSEDPWYWSSTQYSRDIAYSQDFSNGYTDVSGKSWEGGRARAVRRSSLESLIN
jgi:hypothetical protein